MYNDMNKKAKNRGSEWKKRRGIYILPNFLTTGNLFAGFFSILCSVKGEYEKAAIAILVSWIFDILDGKIARLSNATSRFGIEYDSLADLVAFGVAPSLLIYLWAIKDMGDLGWSSAFAFVACGALRLARFNVSASTEAKQYFTGLPIPGAAGMIATTVLFLHPLKPHPGEITSAILMLQTFILSGLMVSNIRYSAFKELDFVKAKPLQITFLTVLLIVVITSKPRIMLFAIMASYVLSGPSLWLGRYLKSVKAKAQEDRSQ